MKIEPANTAGKKTAGRKADTDPVSNRLKRSSGQETSPPSVSKKSQKKAKEKKKRVVGARMSKKEKLVSLGLMRPHNFLSRTEATMTRIFPLTRIGEGHYEVEEREAAVSVILKLVLKTDQTNPMTMDWTTVLWDITQKGDLLPKDVLLTVTRHFERVDDKLAAKAVKRRTNLAILSSDRKSVV